MKPVPLPDDAQRVRVRTSTASLAVEASAGTGKTYLLVIRALYLLLVKKLHPESIVALAFGEKAATELKQRLRAKLEEVASAPTHDALDPEVLAMVPTEPLAAIQERARTALEGLDRAHLSTIHAFASTLIRLYPAESRVDPGFEVVEDLGFAEVVRDEWSRFIAEELGEGAQRRDAWTAILSTVRLTDLYDLGAALADYDTDLNALPTKAVLSDATRTWLLETATAAEELHDEVRESLKKARAGLSGFAATLREAGNGNADVVLSARRDEVARAADLSKSDLPKDLSTKLLHTWNAVSAAAKALRSVPDEATIFAAVDLLLPFARRARERLRLEGKLTYSGLLALARDLLRDHPDVRRQLNRRFRAILLDEAQDVDPVQLELILFLAETPGAGAKVWREVTLEPGKLFVVGDPKQSIYLFRGADVRAFRATLEIMVRQGAETISPVTSMRSAAEVLDSVNAVGKTIFATYPALTQRPDRQQPKTGARAEVLTVEPAADEDPEAVEAAAVAKQVKALLDDGLAATDVAVLFRKRGPMPVFAAALRAAGIEVTIEQERRFYLRQEVMDLLNVLRLLVDPTDAVALVGVLRGPWGGLNDNEVEARFTGFDPNSLFAGEFPRLRRDLFALPAADWVERLYHVLGVEAVAATASDPSARDAVRSFRRLLAMALDRYGVPRTVELLDECVRVEGNDLNTGRPPLEPPPLPTVTAAGAVRFLTVHNAKGLEFPAVILAAIDSTPAVQRSTDTQVLRDWAGGTHGITLRAIGAKEAAATLDGCRLQALRDAEEREETARLVYVALTRARDRLIVVDRKPGNGRRPGRTADTFRPHLAALIEFPNSPATRVTSPVTKARAARPGDTEWSPDVPPVPALRPPLGSEPDLVTPTDLDERLRREEDSGDYLPAGTRSARAWLGELCHEVLRTWDFKTEDPAAHLPAAVDLAQSRLGGPRALPSGLRQQAIDLLTGFLNGEHGQMLRSAIILGREVPLLALGERSAVSARADMVCMTGTAVRMFDYKLSPKAVLSPEVSHSYSELGDAIIAGGWEVASLVLTEWD